MTSIGRIRDFYGVPAHRGMVVKFQGEPVTITGASREQMYLTARDAHGGRLLLHPTWEIEYPAPHPRPSKDRHEGGGERGE